MQKSTAADRSHGQVNECSSQKTACSRTRLRGGADWPVVIFQYAFDATLSHFTLSKTQQHRWKEKAEAVEEAHSQ